MFALDEEEEDISKRQILQEKKEYSRAVEEEHSGYRRKAPPGMKPPSFQKPSVAKPKKQMAMNDDLDDLDDLMGADAKNSSIGAGLNDDEDDFFGGGTSNDAFEVKPKKKKKGQEDDDHDPLAFLQRAQQEKVDNAQRKVMRENEAQAAWKNTDQLKYNLQSKYMEQEDKWKKSIGPDLYNEKSSILNVDT